MNYCPKCGEPLTEGSTFCSNCGAAVEAAPENGTAAKKFSIFNTKFDLFSTDEPLKTKIIVFLVLIAMIGWGGLGYLIEAIIQTSLPTPVAMMFIIPLLVSIVVQGILTFILCWRFFRDKILFLIPALFLSLFGCCLYFIIIPIITIRDIITFFVRKGKNKQ